MDAESLQSVEGTPHERIASKEKFNRMIDALSEAAQLEIITRYAEQYSDSIAELIKGKLTLSTNSEKPISSDQVASLIDSIRVRLSDGDFEKLITGEGRSE